MHRRSSQTLVLCRPRRSIRVGVHRHTERATAWRTMRSKAASRWSAVSTFESLIPSRSNSAGRITAAAPSGPAHAPPPAPRRWPYDRERPPHHLVDRDEPEAEPRIVRVEPVVAQDEERAFRNPYRAVVPRVDRPLQVGLADPDPVDEQSPVPQLHRLAREADHPFDEVLVLGPFC